MYTFTSPPAWIVPDCPAKVTVYSVSGLTVVECPSILPPEASKDIPVLVLKSEGSIEYEPAAAAGFTFGVKPTFKGPAAT